MTRRMMLALAALSALAPLAVDAQVAGGALDRSRPPSLTKPPVLTLPPVQAGALANGIGMQVVEQHEVPLVQVTLVINGGWTLDGVRPGLASFTTRMLTEGAGSRDANALVSELTFLGASLNATALADAFVVSLNVPKRSLAPALDLMADVAMRPTFRAEDLRRQRDLRLASILQRRDQPVTLASIALNQLLFPTGHPYHSPADGDSASTLALDSTQVRAFFERSFVPSRAKFVIVGDVAESEIRNLLAARFGAWKSATEPIPVPVVSTRPAANDAVKIYLVDKPGAAQSVISLGAPGVDRLSPDYAAITVMNTILGGSFSSRLVTNLRETRGYTYGITSGFRWLPLPGPFLVSSSVRTNVTDSSLIEIFKELHAIRDTEVDAKELERAKAYVALGVPAAFETNSQIASQLVTLGSFGLRFSSVSDVVAKVNSVTAVDVQRVARQYVPADKVTLVVVGDLARIRAGIEALKLGALAVLDLSSITR
jgi:zinc protease